MHIAAVLCIQPLHPFRRHDSQRVPTASSESERRRTAPRRRPCPAPQSHDSHYHPPHRAYASTQPWKGTFFCYRDHSRRRVWLHRGHRRHGRSQHARPAAQQHLRRQPHFTAPQNTTRTDRPFFFGNLVALPTPAEPLALLASSPALTQQLRLTQRTTNDEGPFPAYSHASHAFPLSSGAFLITAALAQADPQPTWSRAEASQYHSRLWLRHPASLARLL